MSDIFREVDEDVRRDRVVALFNKYRYPLIGLAAAVILATAGWKGYSYWKATQAEAASGRYDAAVELAGAGKLAEAKQQFDKLVQDAPGGYRELAKLQAAAATARSDPAAGIRAYDALAADASFGPLFQDVARLRAALLLPDGADPKTRRQRLEPLAAPTAPFRHTAREMLVLAALEANDSTAATQWITAILSDPATPGELRGRAEAYLSIVRGMKPAAG